MRPVLLAFFTLALATACSGGSPIPSASTSPSGNAAVYVYAHTTYGVAPGINGNPVPVPTSTASEQSVITPNVTYGGMHGLIEIARTPQGALGKSISYEYYATAKSHGVSQFEEVASSSESDTTARSQRYVENAKLTFTKPFVVVELPFSAGRTWSRSAAYSVTYDQRSYHPANLRINERGVYNADGSYSLALTGAELGNALRGSAALASDGSYKDQSRLGACRQTLDVGAPVKTSGTYAIPYASTAKNCATVPAPAATTIPDWYPGGGLPPSPLRNAVATDMGDAAIPASCGVAPSIATRGEKIVVSEMQFNPLGTVGHNVETSYFAKGIGLVCTETVTTTQEYAVKPPAAKYVGRSVIHTVRALLSYTKGSTVGAPLGFGGVQERAEIVRAGLADRIP